MAQRTVIRLVDDLDGTEIVDGAGKRSPSPSTAGSMRSI